MILHVARAAAVMLLVAAPALAGQRPADSRSLNGRQPRSIVDFMRLYGQPDSIDQTEGKRLVYRWKRVAAMTFGDDDGTESLQKFECEIAVTVGAGGAATRVKAQVANPGALAIASVGAFGADCEKRFGYRPVRRPLSLQRMKR